jgi:hypothetical protein
VREVFCEWVERSENHSEQGLVLRDEWVGRAKRFAAGWHSGIALLQGEYQINYVENGQRPSG